MLVCHLEVIGESISLVVRSTAVSTINQSGPSEGKLLSDETDETRLRFCLLFFFLDKLI